MMRYFIVTILTVFSLHSAVFAQCNINVSISQLPTNVCRGTSFSLTANVSTSGVSFSWKGPNNFTSTNQTAIVPSAVATHTGKYTVIATKLGCPTDSDTITVVVRIPPAKPVINTNAPICIGDTLIINTGGNPTYKAKVWGPNIFSDTLLVASIPNASKANTGAYRAVHIDTLGCISDTGTYTIPAFAINTRPATPTISGNSVMCKGDTLKLLGSPAGIGETYVWTGPFTGQLHIQNIISPHYMVVGRHMFILALDSMGCSSVPDTMVVEVNPTTNPSVIISAKPGFYVGMFTPVTLTANGQDTSYNIAYQWRKNGRDIIGAVNKTHSVTFGVDVVPGDFINVWMSTTPTCAAKDTVLSNPIAFTHKMSVNNVAAQQLQFYPNPVKDMLTVKSSSIQQEVIITTITGVKVSAPIQYTSDQVRVNTTALQPGIYIIRMGNEVARFTKE